MRPTIVFWLALLAAACGRQEEKVTFDESTAPMLVDADWLRAHRDEVVIADMQSTRELYEKGHIPGAVHATVADFRTKEKLLAPVPRLVEKLGALGIDHNTHVVVYDEKHGRNAAWLWYTLTQLGHKKVSLLDGHIDVFRDELVGGPPPVPEPKKYVPRREPTNVVDMEWVRKRVGDPNLVIFDARPHGQYTGEKPKKGMRGGHIPGARNLPYTVFLGPGGRYLPPEEAQKVVGDIPKDQEILLYCNTYHEASNVHFQLARLGYRNIKSFDQGMRFWERDPSLPRKLGEQP